MPGNDLHISNIPQHMSDSNSDLQVTGDSQEQGELCLQLLFIFTILFRVWGDTTDCRNRIAPSVGGQIEV